MSADPPYAVLGHSVCSTESMVARLLLNASYTVMSTSHRLKKTLTEEINPITYRPKIQANYPGTKL